MLITTAGTRIWIATSPVDMRRSFDRLAEHVRAVLELDPRSGHLFVFRSRNGQRVKILWWDSNGLALYYKRLERGEFAFPSPAPATSATVSIEPAQLMKLLAGMPIA